MSELDTYFQPTGRQFGQAGSLQPGTMSAMGRRDAVMGMQNDQRRRLELARRVQRQLGQQSRRGNVRAGLLALDFMDREAAAGQPIPAGISSYESNRARGAQTIMDNEDQIAQMDGVTRGGSNEPLIKNPFVGTDLEEPFNRLWDKPGTRYWDDPTEQAVQYEKQGPVSGRSGSVPRSQQGSSPGAGSLAERTGVSAPSAPAAPAPSPSPMPPGQMDRSGSRFRVGATGNGEGGMLTDSDKELLDAGRRVAGLRPAGFGSRPGGQFGIQVSSVASPAPAPTTPTPSPAAPSVPAVPAKPVKIDEGSLPQETKDRVQALRDRNARFEDVRGFRQAMADGQYKAGMGRLMDERVKLDAEIAQRNQRRAQEDAAYKASNPQTITYGDGGPSYTVPKSLVDRIQKDREDQVKKIRANKANRVTKRSDVKEAEGSIFAGNAYRPVNWTQEDEDASARDMRLAKMLLPLSIFGFGNLAVNRMDRATGRALDPSKWNR